MVCARAGGDEAAAVFNSALGNLLGVFVTPAWVVALLGRSSNVDFLSVLIKLAQRVLLPLFVGQFAQYFLPSVAARERGRVLKKTFFFFFFFFFFFDPTIARAREREPRDRERAGERSVHKINILCASPWRRRGRRSTNQL